MQKFPKYKCITSLIGTKILKKSETSVRISEGVQYSGTSLIRTIIYSTKLGPYNVISIDITLVNTNSG